MTISGRYWNLRGSDRGASNMCES